MEKNYPKTSLLHEDLMVTIQSFSKIFPTEKTEGQYMYLSNIDLLANFNTGIIIIFDGNSELPPEMVIKKLENASQRMLTVYDFLAGRLTPDPQSGRLAIECNSGWIGFAVASSEYSLEQIGKLANTKRAVRGLAVPLDEISSPEDQPLLALQVTSFKCGGIALGLSNNHILVDGISISVFFANLASIIMSEPLVFPPCSNRLLLAPRSPPRVEFPHEEFLEVSIPKEDKALLMKIFLNVNESLENRVLKLSGDDVARLKHIAKISTLKEITSFDVIMAHVWRCKALAENMGNDDKEKTSTILYAVDLRRRLHPPLPLSYIGNALICAYATASLGDMHEKPFHHLVELISKGIDRITDEYVRSHIDWLELHSGFPHGDILVASWLNIAPSGISYPWGKVRYIFPLSRSRKDLVLLLPQIDTEGVIGKGVNVFVDLPSAEMVRFQELFYSSDHNSYVLGMKSGSKL